jgi:signal transduction histidine kinase
MRSLMAVPVASRCRILGNLYLTEKAGATGFDQADEATLVRFATQAAVAIENARLHALAREAAIGEERARLAREMHDSLAQVLGYVNTKAQAAQELLRAGQVDRATDQIGQLGQAAREAYVDVREHLLSLRTTRAADQGFLDALRQYLERWEEQSGVRVDLQADPDDEALGDLPPTAELQLLRIIQEALSNVRKHAGATVATVRLGAADGRLAVAIEDNGAGFDPAALAPSAFPRFGLTGMRERAEAVGGTLEIRSTLGAGTRVLVCRPLGGVRSALPAPAAAATTMTSTMSTTGDGR